MLSKVLDAKVLKSLETFKLSSRRKFLGMKQGGHISLRRGHGIEFSDYRIYEPGDDPRHIDWGVYGRSDKLYVKRFQEEQDLNVYIILDNSSSLFTPSSEQKWESLVRAALAIAYVALQQDDTVSFILVGETQPLICRSVAELNHISGVLFEHKGCNEKDWARQISQFVQQLKFPGVAYFFSDFQYEFEIFSNLAQVLLKKNLELNIVRIAAKSDLQPLTLPATLAEFIDSETEERKVLSFGRSEQVQLEKMWNEHLQLIENYCRQKAIPMSTYNVEHSMLEFIVRDLRPLGILQC